MVFYLVFFLKNKIWVSRGFKTENKYTLHYFEQYVSNKHQTCPGRVKMKESLEARENLAAE